MLRVLYDETLIPFRGGPLDGKATYYKGEIIEVPDFAEDSEIEFPDVAEPVKVEYNRLRYVYVEVLLNGEPIDWYYDFCQQLTKRNR